MWHEADESGDVGMVSRRPIGLGLSLLLIIVIVMGYLLYQKLRPTAGRVTRLRQFLADPNANVDWMIRAGKRCGKAPFLLPSDGYIGFLWGDSFYLSHKHQGIDIFGSTGPAGLGQTPVVAAYAGYLTRLPEWRSSVIIRIPNDPLHPDRQIWTYYTHMADATGNSFIASDFPPGIYEVPVETGTLLGHQGNYSADPGSPTGMHLHFSIVLDDGQGGFKNELELRNTLDPTPYLGIEVNADRAGDAPVVCSD